MSTDDIMKIILAVSALFIIVSFWYAHRSDGNKFNAYDLLLVDGKADVIAVSFMITLALTSWIMIDLQLQKSMTEGYLAIYIGAWVTPLVSKLIFRKKGDKDEDIKSDTEV